MEITQNMDKMVFDCGSFRLESHINRTEFITGSRDKEFITGSRMMVREGDLKPFLSHLALIQGGSLRVIIIK